MNEMRVLSWLTAVLAALGIGLLTHALLSFLSEFLPWIRHRHSRASRLLHLSGDNRAVRPQVHASMDDLVPDDTPWGVLYAMSGIAAVGLYWWSGQRLALALAIVPIAVRSWRRSLMQRTMLADVWQFLMDVRLRLTIEGSLSRALQASSRESHTRMARIVGLYLDGGHDGDGLALLERIADDTGIHLLGDLVARTKAAAAGTLGLDEALRQSMQRLHAELTTRKREQLQRIPSRLILFVFPTLLGPILALLVFPLVARILAQLQGYGMASAGW